MAPRQDLSDPNRKGSDMRFSICVMADVEADELIERIRELERGGLRELMFATGVDEKWRFSEEFARIAKEIPWPRSM